MADEKIKICFLFDPSNDWLRPHLVDLISALSHESRYAINVAAEASLASGQDIVFILGYTKLIAKDVLASNKINLVIHESDLPRGRGFSPVQWQVLEGRSIIPVCMIEAAEEADAGDEVGRAEFRLTGVELWPDIRKLQAAATERLIREFLDHYPSIDRRKQIGDPTYYRKRTKADDALDPDKTIREQFNHMRIADNDRFPLYFEIDGHCYILRVSEG